RAMKIRTRRFELLAATADLVRAEIYDRAEFGRRLGARVPEGWPPPLNDDQSMQWTLKLLVSNPGAEGFAAWYLALPDPRTGEKVLTGNAGFQAKPTADGAVESGYPAMEDRHKNGYVTKGAPAIIAVSC